MKKGTPSASEFCKDCTVDCTKEFGDDRVVPAA